MLNFAIQTFLTGSIRNSVSINFQGEFKEVNRECKFFSFGLQLQILSTLFVTICKLQIHQTHGSDERRLHTTFPALVVLSLEVGLPLEHGYTYCSPQNVYEYFKPEKLVLLYKTMNRIDSCVHHPSRASFSAPSVGPVFCLLQSKVDDFIANSSLIFQHRR